MKTLHFLLATIFLVAQKNFVYAASLSNNNVCLTEHCIAASHRLFQSMNLSADPCEDFSKFACGRFYDEFKMPDDKSRYTAFTPISETLYERGRELLEIEHDEKKDWKIFKQAKDFYKSCMNLDKLEELGTGPLLDILKDVGGWPVLEGDSWDANKFNWVDTIYKMNKRGLGNSYFFKLYVSTDDKDSTKRSIFLDQPSLGLSREYLVKGFDDKDVQSYFTFMKDSVKFLGGDVDKIEEELKQVLLFEIKLANLSAPREERRNATKLYNPFIIKEYPVLKGHPNWHQYINNIIHNVEIDPSETVVVVNPVYVKNASKLLTDTDPKILSNYIGWRITKSLFTYLNKEAKSIYLKYSKALTGVESDPPRWKTCTRATGFNSYSSGNFRYPAAAMYVGKYFTPIAKKATLEMIEYIKEAFRTEILAKIDWMDENTKEKAYKKLKHMKEFIAYPDEILNENLVEKHHEELQAMHQDNYLCNALELTKWNRANNFLKLRKKVDKNDWKEHSLVALVNAFYNPSINSIEFPAGILQGIFYDHRVPNALNFGGIGGVIGHEITHGFDDQGRQYDFEGNLKGWWDEETKKKFIKKAKCIIDQYSNFHNEQTGLNLNGINTQGENIADNGGVKESYIAYKKWLAENNGEPTLPGHDFTNEQLFWISWGQIWCGKYRDGALKQQILTGAHSPGYYRINGPLMNSPEFAEDFKCSKDSKMNAENKCSVW